MIVPRPSLIALAAITVIPLLGWAVMAPGFAPLVAGVLLLLGAVTGLDVFWGRMRLKGVKVILPAKLRLIQGRPGKFDLGFESRLGRPLHLRAALAFPAELPPTADEMTIDLPAEAGRHYFTCECAPRQRGLFTIEGCYYETVTPFRFWEVRGKTAQPVEVRVYPNMESERKQVASIFLRTRHSGTRAVRQLGQGREFEKLREYVSGDGYDTLHWKATARRGHPITKVFQVEKTQEVYVIIDASRLSARLQVPGDPSQGTRLDRYISAALVLGLAAEKQGDLFGLATFSDRMLSFVRARNGKEHYGACREALYRLEPQAVSPDFEEAVSFARLRLRRRALLIFMTDLDDPILMESFQRAIDVVCRKHLVLVQMLRPENIRPLFTNPDVARVDEIYQDLAQHMAWHDLRQLTIALKQHGVGLSLFAREQFSAEATSAYIRVKQRQLL
jgi:uncharacterized protein (DUF58 family)